MKRILSALLFFVAFSANAQIIVVSDINGNPVADAKISDGKSVVYTTEKGMADISVFAGKDITISKDGFYTVTLSWDKLENMNFKLSLYPNTFEIEEVVVSANKWEQPRSEVSADIVPVDISTVAQLAPQTAADLLGETGKVFIQKSQLGGGSPMIRGFAANRVLIVVDGVRMNNAIYRSGNLQNVINIDPYSLGSSEIILGPASNMYGSDAIGGVMDFHTKMPEFSSSKKPLVTGNFNTALWSADKAYTGHVDLNVGFSKIAFLTSFTRSSFSDMRMGSYGPDDYLRPFYQARIEGKDTLIPNSDPRLQVPSGFDQTYFMQKVSLAPSKNTILTYAFHYSTTSDVPRYDRLIQPSDDGLKYAQWYYGPQKWIMHHLQLLTYGKGALFDKLRVTASYQNYSESRHDRKFGSTDLRERYENVKVYTLNADLLKTLSRKTTVFYGLEGVYNYVSSTGFITNIETNQTDIYPSRYPDGSEYESFAVYSQFKTKLTDRLILDYGLRYTFVYLHAPFDTTFYKFPFTEANLPNSAPSGSFGFVYSLNQKLKYKFNFSTGFRAPNIDDVGKVFDSEPGKVIVPNKDLQPEYVYSVETGWHYYGEKLYTDFTVFYSYLDNAMVRDDFEFDGQDSIIYDGVLSRVQALVNADYAQVYGLEATLAVGITDFLKWKNNFVWSKGYDSNGEPLRHIPPAYASSYLIFENNKGLHAQVFAVYNSEIPYDKLAPSEQDKPHLYAKDPDGNPYCPSWWTLNFSLSWKINNMELTAGVKNILDKRYRPYSSGITAAGRDFYFTAAYSFR